MYKRVLAVTPGCTPWMWAGGTCAQGILEPYAGARWARWVGVVYSCLSAAAAARNRAPRRRPRNRPYTLDNQAEYGQTPGFDLPGPQPSRSHGASHINDYQAFDQALREHYPDLAHSFGHELDLLLARSVKRAQASPHCRVDETLAHKPK
jgi:hypothetical protein